MFKLAISKSIEEAELINKSESDFSKNGNNKACNFYDLNKIINLIKL